MKVGTSLRGHFPLGDEQRRLFMEFVKTLPPDTFYDVPMGDADPRRQAANLVEVAAAARDAGLDFLLIGDHHALPLTSFFQPTPTLGRLLAETGDMPVGVLYLAPFYHPITIAEHVGTLAAFAPEPVTLVLAIGGREGQFAAFGMQQRERVGRTEECISIVRRLLAGEMVTHQGRYYTLHNAKINPIPRAATPIWIGGRVGPAVERAGRLGDGWLTGTTSTDAQLEQELERYRQAAEAHGRPFRPVLRKDVFVADSDEEARRIVGPILEAEYRGMGWDDVIAGGSDTVVARLTHYRHMGFQEVLLRHIVGDHERMLESFDRLGKQVLPQVRNL